MSAFGRRDSIYLQPNNKEANSTCSKLSRYLEFEEIVSTFRRGTAYVSDPMIAKKQTELMVSSVEYLHSRR